MATKSGEHRGSEPERPIPATTEALIEAEAVAQYHS